MVWGQAFPSKILRTNWPPRTGGMFSFFCRGARSRKNCHKAGCAGSLGKRRSMYVSRYHRPKRFSRFCSESTTQKLIPRRAALGESPSTKKRTSVSRSLLSSTALPQAMAVNRPFILRSSSLSCCSLVESRPSNSEPSRDSSGQLFSVQKITVSLPMRTDCLLCLCRR